MTVVLSLLIVIYSSQECESDPCCEGSTCKLKSFAECAYGDCCKDCWVRSSSLVGKKIKKGKICIYKNLFFSDL